jgi:hypothetical protein
VHHELPHRGERSRFTRRDALRLPKIFLIDRENPR